MKGGILPFHKTVTTNRNSPKRAAGAQGSFDCRREAPGVPGAGAQFLPTQDPNWSSDVPPLPDRSTLLSGGRGAALALAWGGTSSARVSRSRAMPVWRPALRCRAPLCSGTPSGPGGSGRRPAFPCLRATVCGRRLATREKNNGSELRSLPAFSGECVKGGILPFHKTVTTNRNSPKRAEGARGSCDSRREAPGGSRAGA